MGCVLPAGHRPGARAPGGDRRRASPTRVGVRDGQQGVRLGPRRRSCSARNAIAPASTTSSSPAAWSRCRNAPYLLPKAREGLPAGARAGDRLDDPRRPVGRVQATSTWATAPSCAPRRRASRARAGRVRRRVLPARARARRPRASSSGEIVAGRDRRRQGAADRRRRRRGAGPRRPRQAGRRCAPAFQKDGTVTAGNASSINDGAAALVLMSRRRGRGARLRSRSRASSAPAGHAQAPEWFTTAPAGAIERAARAAPAGRRTTSTSGRSTRRSRSSRSRTTSCSGSTRRR